MSKMRKKKNAIRESMDNRIFNHIVTALLLLFGILALYPILFVHRFRILSE